MVAAVLVAIAGVQLYILTTRTADFFAWTIGIPLTAAFLGAGYWANLPGLLLAQRLRLWQQVRVYPIATLVFTLFILLTTLRHLDAFHFESGPFSARAAAWAWLLVYLLLPVPLLAIIVGQERAGGRHEYAVSQPLAAWFRALLLLQAVGFTLLGLGLSFAPEAVTGIWPWKLTALPAGAVGAWLLGIAAGSWGSFRERDWSHVRVFMPTYLVFFMLQLLAAVRFRGSFTTDGAHTWAYLGIMLTLLIAFALASWTHERTGRAIGGGGESLE